MGLRPLVRVIGRKEYSEKKNTCQVGIFLKLECLWWMDSLLMPWIGDKSSLNRKRRRLAWTQHVIHWTIMWWGFEKVLKAFRHVGEKLKSGMGHLQSVDVFKPFCNTYKGRGLILLQERRGVEMSCFLLILH